MPPAKQIELRMPSMPQLANWGTTGMLLPKFLKDEEGSLYEYPKLVDWSPEIVKKTIAEKANSYGAYIPDVWDCEDYAYLAAADARLAYPGIPAGILVGEEHTINVFWLKKGNEWFPWYYDATTKKDITPPFNTKIIVSLPIGWSADSRDYKDLNPFLNYPHLNATIALDRAPFDYEAIEDIEKKLMEWVKIDFVKAKADGKFIPTDRLFYWFAHIRYWYAHERNKDKSIPKKVPPIGVGFGKIKTKDQEGDYQVLILWKSPGEYIFFDVRRGTEVDQNLKSGFVRFVPRLVII